MKIVILISCVLLDLIAVYLKCLYLSSDVLLAKLYAVDHVDSQLKSELVDYIGHFSNYSVQ